MATIPSQRRILDPYADHRFSNSINAFTRLITGGKDVILPFDVDRSVFEINAVIPNAFQEDPHPYDTNRDFIIDDDELTLANVDRINSVLTQDQYDRIVELAPGYHLDPDSPDGFAPNTIIEDTPYPLDYDEDWRISDDELDLINSKWNDYYYNRYGAPNGEDDVTSFQQLLFARQANASGGYQYDGTSESIPTGYKPVPKGVALGPLEWDVNGDWKIDYNEYLSAQAAYSRSEITLAQLLKVIQIYNVGGYHPWQTGEDLDPQYPDYTAGAFPAQKIKMGPGYLIRQDTLIHVKGDSIIDLTDTANYIGVTSPDFGMNREASKDSISTDGKMYMILAKYVYSRSKPEPELAYVIAQNRQAYLQNMEDYIYLGSFEVAIGNGSPYLGITRIFDWDTNENEGGARIERPMYFHHVSEVDGGILDENGHIISTGTSPVSEAVLFE